MWAPQWKTAGATIFYGEKGGGKVAQTVVSTLAAAFLRSED
jgi:hypothetical protein